MLNPSHAALLECLGRAPASDYRYPHAEGDRDRTVHAWMRVEERGLLEEALALVLGGREGRGRGVALDAGCGSGENLDWLAQRFDQVVGIEPDARRSAEARRKAPQVPVFTLPLGGVVLAAREVAGAVRVGLCLQVLGHVQSGEAARMLTSLARLVAPQGALVLALPYCSGPEDVFLVSELVAPAARPIDAPAFDELASCPRPGALPVRHYSMPSLESLVAGAGLRIEWHAPYGWIDERLANLLVLARHQRSSAVAFSGPPDGPSAGT